MIYKILFLAVLVTSCGMEEELKGYLENQEQSDVQEIDDTNSTLLKDNVQNLPIQVGEVEPEEDNSVNVNVTVNVNMVDEEEPKELDINDFFGEQHPRDYAGSGRMRFGKYQDTYTVRALGFTYSPSNKTWYFDDYEIVSLDRDGVIYDAIKLDDGDTYLYLYIDRDGRQNSFGMVRDLVGNYKHTNNIRHN